MSIIAQLEEEIDGPFLDVVRDFLESDGENFDPARLRDDFEFHLGWDVLRRILEESELDSSEEINALHLLAMDCAVFKECHKLSSFLRGKHHDRTVEIVATLDPAFRPTNEDLARGLIDGMHLTWRLAEEPSAESPFADAMSNWIWIHGTGALMKVFERGEPHPDFFQALLQFRPELLDEIIEHLQADPKRMVPAETWLMLIQESEAYDERFLAAVKTECMKPLQAHTSDVRIALGLVKVLGEFNTMRGGGYDDLMLEILGLPEFATAEFAVGLLYRHDPLAALPLVAKGIEIDAPYVTYGSYFKLLAVALDHIEGAGKEFLLAVLRAKFGLNDLRREAMDRLLAEEIPDGSGPSIHAIIMEVSAGYKGADLASFWMEVAPYPTRLFDDEFREFLTGTSKVLRGIAAARLASTDPDGSQALAEELPAAKRVNERLGAVALLCELGEAGVPELQTMHGTELNRKVHEAVEAALGKLGAPILAVEGSGDASLAELEASIAKDKHLRAPNRKWMTLDGLVLRDAEGKALSDKALYFLIQQQSKHKAIEAAPGIVPLLGHLPREQNAGVVSALLGQWIASDQAASERWVLTLAGLLGDGRVVPPIAAGIHRWSKALRKELAECGVRALALLGTDEALMVLNDVALRYTSKALNVGRAAAEAFQAEADARGVDLEALRDMVVPDLGFDADNVRVISSGNAGTHAVLQPDGVLTWRSPDTGKETKNPPSKLPADVKAEIKGLKALLRETIKSQTARLELAMVCQRRWSLADWKALFEGNPLMRSFSSRLVFGVYDEEHTLRSAFRCYPNGITADAAGEMVDIEDGEGVVGLVHPLELEEDVLESWREHLARFEIAPPFPQLTRKVHALDPLHGNRRELQAVKGTQMAQGTMFSRSERLGWHRGSVVDGGELCSVYKVFATAGIEVILELRGFYMGGGWESWGTLDAAFFVKPGTVKRGAYVVDDPTADDARALTFTEVPPIVYSETIADLHSIAGQ